MLYFALLLGGVAPGTPSAAMIMEGLETLVAPSHHTFLLTESAAAAHFNVLSFDTCLFKTTAQTSPSTAVTSAATYLPAASNFAGSHLGSQTLLHYNLTTSSSANSPSAEAALHTVHPVSSTASTNSALSRTASGHRLSSFSVVAEAQQQHQHHLSSPGHNSPAIVTATISVNQAAANNTSSSASSGRNSASHLSLLNTTQHSPVSGNSVSASAADSVDIKQSQIEAQPGDLNTPVTTSSDIPSFFGPSTVVEPPPITGKA